MKVHIYDTLSRDYRDLTAENYSQKPLNLYVCGPTVYNLIHIGNARTLVVFDVFVRLLRTLGFKINYLRNITDVDDKIIQAANAEGIQTHDVAKKYTDMFHEDVDRLRLIRPDVTPTVTDHMDDIIAAISKLLETPHAYKLPDGVYYDVASFQKYGDLSKKKQEDLLTGVRVDLTDKKKHPGDFAVWKFSKPGEPSWEAPFGAGRPGWHIECSVMAMKYSPGGLDIHGGGIDLIHPHHENEIAQSEAIDPGKPFSKMWMHAGFLNIGKEKMSKSLGNFIQLRKLLSYFHPEVLRLFLLSGHYRSPLDFGVEKLVELHHSLWRYYTQKEEMRALFEDVKTASDVTQNTIFQAMADDFNTAKAVGMIFEYFKRCYKNFRAQKVTEEDIRNIGYILQVGDVLGVFTSESEYFFKEVESLMLKQVDLSKSEIEDRIRSRQEARNQKDYTLSDTIREELQSHHVCIQDLEDGKVSWCLTPDLI